MNTIDAWKLVTLAARCFNHRLLLPLISFDTKGIDCDPEMTTIAGLPNAENEKLRQRFEKEGLWLGWQASPHPTINWERFSRCYKRTPLRWKKALSFMAITDLITIKPGEYSIANDEVFVKVQQYYTREKEDTRYEAHRKFADIQYVATGVEWIGIAELSSSTVTQAYDDSKDIVFLTATKAHYYQASKENFFIFLPEDPHRPCIKDEVCALVKKVVVKVRID